MRELRKLDFDMTFPSAIGRLGMNGVVRLP